MSLTALYRINIIFRTTEILTSAHHYGGATLKRFVLLGSAVSVLNSFEDITREGRPYTEKDWNPVRAAATHMVPRLAH